MAFHSVKHLTVFCRAKFNLALLFMKTFTTVFFSSGHSLPVVIHLTAAYSPGYVLNFICFFGFGESEALI